jgi:hypothetical protein
MSNIKNIRKWRTVLCSGSQCCNVVQSFWPVEELEELADGPTGYGEVARAWCLFAWNFSLTRSSVGLHRRA